MQENNEEKKASDNVVGPVLGIIAAALLCFGLGFGIAKVQDQVPTIVHEDLSNSDISQFRPFIIEKVTTDKQLTDSIYQKTTKYCVDTQQDWVTPGGNVQYAITAYDALIPAKQMEVVCAATQQEAAMRYFEQYPDVLDQKPTK